MVCGYDLSADVFPRAERNENSNIGKNCPMAVEDIFANSSVAPVVVLATSKRWMRENR